MRNIEKDYFFSSLQGYYIFLILIALCSLFPAPALAGTDTWTEVLKPDTSSNSFRTIAIHPTKPDTLFVGNDSSLFFRSYNGGTSWTGIYIDTDTFKILQIALDPQKPDTVVFAITDSGGAYQSVNTGLTWHKINAGLRDTNLTALAINRNNSQIMYVGSDSGVFKSLNKGSSWFPVNAGLDSLNVSTLTMDPNDPASIYAGTSTGDIYLTVNSGASWTRRNSSSLASSIVRITVNPENSNIIYIGTQNNGVYTSTDKGSSISALSTGLTELRILSLAIDTSGVNKLYAGTNTDGAFRLNEGSTTWQAINSGLTSGIIYSLAVTPSRTHKIWAGTRGLGVYSYTGNRVPVITHIPDKWIAADSTLEITVYAYDPDSLETKDLRFGAIGLPSSATYDSFATHEFNWTPDSSKAGLDTVIFTVNDQRGGSVRDTVIITVNRLPVFTAVGAKSVNENDSLSFIIAATDADGDTITYRVSTLNPNGTTTKLPSGAVFDTLTGGTFVWRPSYATVDRASGSKIFQVTFSALDSLGGIKSMTVPITVHDKNRPPTISGLQDTYYVNEGNALEFEVVGSDLDLDPLTYGRLTALPGGASFDSTGSHKFSWVPTFSDSGSSTIIFKVQDDRGGIARDTVAIVVRGTNRTPVLGTLADSFFVNVNDSITISISGTDADGDTVIYSAAGVPAGALFTASTRKFRWVPNLSQNGTYAVTFSIADGHGGFDFKKVYIVVNYPPQFLSVADAAVNEGQTVSIMAKADDQDGDSLTFTVENLPSGAATAYFTDSVRVTWVTNFASSGSYAFRFIAADRKHGRDTVLVQVSVANVNQPPDFAAVAAKTVNAGQSLQFTVNATDIDNEALTYLALRLPSGAAFDASTRQFSWSPSITQLGTDTSKFRVADPGGLSDTLIVLITVTNNNFTPVISSIDPKTVKEGTEIVFAVVAQDSNGDTLKYSVSSLPSGAIFDTTARPAPIFKWTPTYAQAGSYNVIFGAIDGKGGNASRTVSITVTNLNRAPVMSFASDTTIPENTPVQLNLNVQDPDGDAVTVTILPQAPQGASIQQAGAVYRFDWTPTYQQAGTYNLTIRSADPSDSASTRALNLTVQNVSRAPSLPAIIYPRSGEAVTPETYLIWQRSYDPDLDDVLTYRLEFDRDSTFATPDLVASGIKPDSAVLSKIGSRGGSRSLEKSDGFMKTLRGEQAAAGVEAVAVRINEIIGFSTLEENTPYYWRVRGEDEHGTASAYSAAKGRMTFLMTNSAPAPVGAGFVPSGGYEVSTLTPTISWNPARDPDPEDDPSTISYVVEIDQGDFNSGYRYKYVTGKGQSSVSVTTPLSDNMEWHYRIQALDDEGAESYYSDAQEFYTNVENDPPISFNLMGPDNNEGIRPSESEIEFNWEPASDPDPKDSLTYSIELSLDSLFQRSSIVISTENIPGDKLSAGLSTLLLPQKKYFWRVIARDRTGLITPSNQVWSFVLSDDVTGIEDANDMSGVPEDFTLLQNYPNPFNGETIIRFGLPRASSVRIGIYNLLGQLVAELMPGGRLSEGWHRVRWDGMDGEGRQVATGIYLVRMQGEGVAVSKKALYIK